MFIMPSLLQLKYLDKPCSPPSIPLRFTLATFLILLLHAWHLHTYPVLKVLGFGQYPACPVLCLFLSFSTSISHPVAQDSLSSLALHTLLCFAVQSTGAVSCRVPQEVILTSHTSSSV